VDTKSEEPLSGKQRRKRRQSNNTGNRLLIRFITVYFAIYDRKEMTHCNAHNNVFLMMNG